MGRLVIFGAGGCGGDMLRAALHCYGSVVFADDSKAGEEFLGRRVIHPDQMNDSDHFIPALGNGAARAKIIERFSDYKLATIVAPTAIIGPGVEIGEGAAIHDFVIVTSRTLIGRDCQINIRSCIGHDNSVGDHVTFSPHVCLNSRITIEDLAVLGPNCTVRSGAVGRPIIVGQGARVGCGSTVFHSVPCGQTVVGNPARPLREALRAIG